MSVIALNFLGRFGNNLFSYAFARAYSELHGLELQTDPWIGQKIFNLNDPPITATNLKPRNENDLVDGESDILFRSYCQQQKCLIYTKRDCMKWFQFMPWVYADVLANMKTKSVVGHQRVGDYLGYGYPVVSAASYINHNPNVWLLREENPTVVAGISEEFRFLPDFLLMMTAGTLLRGNSSFSWWAATLNPFGKIYSPVVEGLEGGKEHHVNFVPGNWPRFANLEFTTDLHLKP